MNKAPKHTSNSKRLHKRIAIDIAGFGLIIAGIILSPVPGPGGIPLIVIGLAILAQNYEWAQKILDRFRDYIAETAKKSFPKDRGIMIFYDIITPLILALGLWLIISIGGKLWLTVGIFATFWGIGIFFGNRQRGERLYNWFKELFRR